MTTSKQVQDKWYDSVLNATEVLEYCSNFYSYPISITSEFEIATLFDANHKINYINYLVSRTQEFQISNLATQNFTVRIEHTRELLVSDEAASHDDLQATLEAIEDKAVSALGKTWDGLVDYWLADTSTRAVELVTISGRACIRSQMIFNGFNM